MDLKNLVETEEQANQVKLETLQTDKANGLARCDQALQNLGSTGGLANDPNVEERLRQLETGLRGLATATNALNSLLEVIAHDLVQMIMGHEKQNAALVLNSVHLQSMLDVLKQKNVLTEEELKEAFKANLPKLKQQQ